MRGFTVIFSLLLNFATLASYLVFLAGLPIVQQTLALKDVCLLLGVLAFLPGFFRRILNGNLDSIDWLIVLALLVNIASFVASSAPLADKIINFRRNTSFLMILLVFREFGAGFRQPSSLFSLMKGVLLFIWIFGVVEYLLPDSFWNDLVGISSYWSALSIDPFATSTIAENGRFYSWDLMSLMGGPVRRMVSIYFEPTTLAAFFISCFCMSLARRERLWPTLIAIFGSLTISKFFVLSVPLALLLFHFRDSLGKHFFFVIVACCLSLSVAVVSLEIESGAILHLKGVASLVDIVMQNKWFGLGLGGGGNYSDAELDTAEIGAESGFGNIAAQLGVGVFIYVLLLNAIYISLLTRYRETGDLTYAAAISALASWSVSFLLSASSLGLSGNAFFFIFIGTVLYHARKARPLVSSPSLST